MTVSDVPEVTGKMAVDPASAVSSSLLFTAQRFAQRLISSYRVPTPHDDLDCLSSDQVLMPMHCAFIPSSFAVAAAQTKLGLRTMETT